MVKFSNSKFFDNAIGSIIGVLGLAAFAGWQYRDEITAWHLRNTGIVDKNYVYIAKARDDSSYWFARQRMRYGKDESMIIVDMIEVNNNKISESVIPLDCSRKRFRTSVGVWHDDYKMIGMEAVLKMCN